LKVLFISLVELNALYFHKRVDQRVISGFRREVVEICDVLGYYAVYGGNSLPKFWDNVSFPSSRVQLLTLEDGTDTLSRKFGNELRLYAA